MIFKMARTWNFSMRPFEVPVHSSSPLCLTSVCWDIRTTSPLRWFLGSSVCVLSKSDLISSPVLFHLLHVCVRRKEGLPCLCVSGNKEVYSLSLSNFLLILMWWNSMRLYCLMRLLIVILLETPRIHAKVYDNATSECKMCLLKAWNNWFKSCFQSGKLVIKIPVYIKVSEF